MLFNQEKSAVVFLDENKLSYFSVKTGQFFTLQFPADITSDMEIKDKQQFVQLLTNFIAQNKIAPANIIMAISDNLCFTKDIPNNNPQIAEESQSFIETVPFESIGSVAVNKLLVSKSPNQAVTTIIATNKDFYDTTQAVFEQKKFVITHIFPLSVLSVIGLAGQTTFDQATARFILNNLDMLKNYNFQIEVKTKLPTGLVTLTSSTPASHNRTMVLVGVFIILLIILVILIVTRLKPAP